VRYGTAGRIIAAVKKIEHAFVAALELPLKADKVGPATRSRAVQKQSGLDDNSGVTE